MYTPDDIVTKVHDWHRFNAANGLKAAPNAFNPDWQSDAGRNYMEGVMSIAGVYFALGVVFFLIYSLVNLLAVCCSSRRDRNKKHTSFESCCNKMFSPRAWYVVATIILLGGAAAAISNLTRFHDTINSTVSSLDSFDGILTNTSNLLSGELLPELAGVNTTLFNLQAVAVQNGDNAALTMINDMISNNNAATTAATAASNDLGSAARSLNEKLHEDGDNDAQDVGKKVFIGGATALGLFIALLLLSCSGLMAKRCCSVFFRVCNVVLIISLLLVYVFTGMFVAVTVVSSDVCVAPSDAILKVVVLTQPDQDTLDTLQFYTTCGNSTDAVPAGAYAKLMDGSATVQSALAYAEQFSTYAASHPEYSPFVGFLSGNLTATNASLNVAISYVSCAPIFGIYDGMVGTLCNSGFKAVMTVWALGTAGCILIFILVTSGARLCWRHPGDDVQSFDTLATAVYANPAAPLLSGGATAYTIPADWATPTKK